MSKTAFIVIFFSCLLVIPLVHAQDKVSLKESIEKHYAEINAGDSETINNHHLDNFSHFPWFGGILSTSNDQALEESLNVKPITLEYNVIIRDFKAQLYDNVGVATFYLTGDYIHGDLEASGTWRASAVWIYGDGQWREAHHHESILQTWGAFFQ